MPTEQPSEQATGDSAMPSQADRAGETLPGRPQSEASDLCAGPPELANHPRYRIVRLLGRGGMGAVYQAIHKVMDRPVALKVMKPDLIENTAAVERFRREVKTAAQLVHPNIVTAFDAEQVGDLHFLVMEYVEGQTLAELVTKTGPLPVSAAAEYISQTAQGLQYAYEKGMIHRDIKPHNLMLAAAHDSSLAQSTIDKPRSDCLIGESDIPTPAPKPEIKNPKSEIIKILDFGLARFATDGSGPGQTSSGMMLGTVDFMAPEQADNARSADIRSDIYSLGCTLYYLLAGRVPFPDGSIIQRVMAHVESPPPPLTKFRNDLPAGLIAVVERMLAKNPADRYQTPVEVIRALAPFRDALGGASAKIAAAPTQSAAANLTASTPIVLEAIPANRSSTKNRRLTSVPDPAPSAPAPRKGRMLFGCFLLAALTILSVAGVVAYGVWLIVDRVSTGVGKIVDAAKQHQGQAWDEIEASFKPPPPDSPDNRLFPKKLGDLPRQPTIQFRPAISEIGLEWSGKRADFGTGKRQVSVYVYYPVKQSDKETIFKNALDASSKHLGNPGTVITSGSAKDNGISVVIDRNAQFGLETRFRCRMWWNQDWLFVIRTDPEVDPDPLAIRYLNWLMQAEAPPAQPDS